jgi:soluble lytic murein transglycosylase-like protein
MRRSHLQPALVGSGRPSPSRSSARRRTTVYSLPISSIPIALAIFLAILTAWSFTLIGPRLHAALQSAAAFSATPDATFPLPSTVVESIPLSGNFSPQVLFWSDEIFQWAHEYQMDPNLIALVMQIESCGYSQAQSRAGASGLFQVMPFHFGYNENPYDPSTNAERGLSYLARALELADGRLDLALAGYNGGHQMIQTNPSLWPEETQRYVYWGVRIYNELDTEASLPPTLRQWLDAGGKHLCEQAAAAQAE